MTPQTVNAYYNPSMNEIVFPAAILQPPFFDADADDAVNYGGIGAVIGHEISHGFDDQGSQYDGDGNLRNWWTADDREHFEAKTAALVAQYDAYSPLPGYHVNGELTLGENIADNSGLPIAYKAYQLSLDGKPAPVIDGLTGDQRFFLGFAQVWRDKVREPPASSTSRPTRTRRASSAPTARCATSPASTRPSTSSRATGCTCRPSSASRSGDDYALKLRDRLLVELEAEAGFLRQHELAVLDRRRLLVQRQHPRHVFDREAVGAPRRSGAPASRASRG